MIGKTLNNRYTILEKIDSGGMSVVYKAKCNVLERFVAIKVLKNEFLEDKDIIHSFLKEAKSVAGLSSPNIVNIYDVSTEENIYYIVMEYIDGKNLKTYIKEKRNLDEETAIKIIIKILEGLKLAHSKGIIHRDIKSQNIMITYDEVVKVMDFGIAKTINSDTINRGKDILGSIHYMSPEQIKGDVVDKRTDVYSVGIVMYEMLTGKVPFIGKNLIEIGLKQVQEIPEPISKNFHISQKVVNIVYKSLEKDRENRYGSVEEIQREFQSINYSIEKEIDNTENMFKTQILPKKEINREMLIDKSTKGSNARNDKRVYLEEKKLTEKEKIIQSGKNILNKSKKENFSKISIKSYAISVFAIIFLFISILYIFPIKTYYYKILYEKTSVFRNNISNSVNRIQN